MATNKLKRNKKKNMISVRIDELQNSSTYSCNSYSIDSTVNVNKDEVKKNILNKYKRAWEDLAR